jgi:hypothetical protein
MDNDQKIEGFHRACPDFASLQRLQSKDEGTDRTPVRSPHADASIYTQ